MRALVIVLVITLVLCSVPVEALRTVETDQLVYIYPDENLMEWNSTYNASAPEAQALSNYNASAIPFMNATGITGTFTGPFTPPMFYQVANETNWTQDRVTTIVRFKSEEVMSGSSVSWWRCPALGFQNPDENWTITFRIWHVDAPGLLDADIVEDLVAGGDNMARTSLVFARAYGDNATYGGGENVTYYWQNYTAGDVWDYSDTGANLSFLWLRVDAMVHADESYVVDWNLWSAEDSLVGLGKRLTFTSCDVGDNGIYKTWLKFNSTAVLVECDLDISVLHQFGIGHSVSGWEILPPGGGDVGGGGGGGGGFMPSDQDAMTEDLLSPTGTVDGGIWDGDWSGYSSSVYADSDPVYYGAESVYWYSISGAGDHARYDLDSYVDVSSAVYFNFSWYAGSGMASVQVRLYSGAPAGANYYYKTFSGFPAATWDERQDDISGWSGWSVSNSPDMTELSRILFYSEGASGNCNIDGIHFSNESAGGGDGNYTLLQMYDTLEEPPDEPEDNLTFFMPFMYPVDNTTDVKVNITNLNSTWGAEFWVADWGPCDFAIRSFSWGNDWSSDTFKVKVYFYANNSIFVHDDNADYDVWYPSSSTYSNNYFTVLDTSNTSLYGNVFYRPYHSLQTTDGEWVNTQVPDSIIFGGRYVNMSDLQMRNESYTPPLAMKVLNSMFLVYNYVDKVVFRDMLPNLDAEHFLDWTSNGLQNIKGKFYMLNVKIGQFVEVVKAFVAYAGHTLAGIARGVILFVSVIVFVAICLYTNGVKNFFLVGVREGVVAMGEYAIGFLKRSFSIASFGRWG